MTEANEGQAPQVSVFSHAIEASDGVRYQAKMFQMDRPIGDAQDNELSNIAPQLLEVGKRCFGHWKDDGKYFMKKLTENANRVSVVYAGERIIGFNMYQQFPLEVDGVAEPINAVYTHYAGVDPEYRGKGLMARGRIHDTEALNPDVISGCTATGEVLKGVRSTAKRLGRVMFPTMGEPVPQTVLNIGRALYDTVNRGDGPTVDDMLVRHGEGTYQRGDAHDPLQDMLPTGNDAILYTSFSPSFAATHGLSQESA